MHRWIVISLALIAASAGCKSDSNPSTPDPQAEPVGAAPPKALDAGQADAAAPAQVDTPDAGVPAQGGIPDAGAAQLADIPDAGVAQIAGVNDASANDAGAKAGLTPDPAPLAWGSWDLKARASCGEVHKTQLGAWIQAHCQLRTQTRERAHDLTDHVNLAIVNLPYSRPPSEAVIHWDAYSTEAPNRAGIGGRQSRFKDEGGRSFSPDAIRSAFPDIIGTPILAVDRERPAGEVIEALKILRDGHYKEVAFAFETTTHPVPLPPDAARIGQFRWQASAPFMRDALQGCDGALQVFKSSVDIPLDERCGWTAQRLPPAITACKCKMKQYDDFLINLHLFLRPPRITTVVTVGLGGDPVKVDPARLWGELAPELFSTPPRTLRLEAR